MSGLKTSPFPKLVLGIEASELIPVELGGKLIAPIESVTELGKELLQASVEGNVEQTRLLLNKGAPFTSDWLGTTSLHLAAQNNHPEICEMLLNAGISKDTRTKVDRTPLHIAAYEGHITIVELLLKHGVFCDSKDLLLMTPLHWAVQNNHKEIVELLLNYGAHTEPVNKFELTPIDIAMQNDRPDIAELIKNAITDPTAALESLAVELKEMDSNGENTEEVEETVRVEDEEEDSGGKCVENSTEKETETPLSDDNFSESIKFLQQYGITMAPVDDSNIFNSIIESGHSVVLTDIGKDVLNSTKPTGKQVKAKTSPPPVKAAKIITVTPQEFVAMTSNLNQGKKVLKQVNAKTINHIKAPILKKVKKNKINPISRISKVDGGSDVELLMNQLIEARKLVEEYKQKYLKKQAEAERYKQQLKLLMQTK